MQANVEVNPTSLQGQLLIAQPSANSTFFANSVVLVCEHHAKGAWGLMLTKPHPGVDVDTLAHDIDIPVKTDKPLYMGGPVEDHGLHFLHTPDVIVSNTFSVTPEVYVTSSEAMLREIQEGRGPLHWRLFLGISAWQGGQLEGEQSGEPPWTPQHRWLTQPCPRNIFTINPKDLWIQCTDSVIKNSVNSFF